MSDVQDCNIYTMKYTRTYNNCTSPITNALCFHVMLSWQNYNESTIKEEKDFKTNQVTWKICKLLGGTNSECSQKNNTELFLEEKSLQIDQIN